MDKTGNFQRLATGLFKEGYACSEAIIRAAYDCGIVQYESDISTLTQIASPFAGGAGTHGCICGALAGAQMLVGCLIGRDDINCPNDKILSVSKALVEDFKGKGHTPCCRASLPDFNETPEERMVKCTKIIEDVIEVLTINLLKDLELQTA